MRSAFCRVSDQHHVRLLEWSFGSRLQKRMEIITQGPPAPSSSMRLSDTSEWSLKFKGSKQHVGLLEIIPVSVRAEVARTFLPQPQRNSSVHSKNY
jgi:hypothetical protein